MRSLYKKSLYTGQRLVTPEVSKVLKELGWNWKTQAILKVKSEEVVIPVKDIDCNIGDTYRYLPTLQQVISWLENWGITFSYRLSLIEGKIYYDSFRIVTARGYTSSPSPSSTSTTFENLIEDNLMYILIFLKNSLKGVIAGGRWSMEGAFKHMLKNNHIIKTEIYNHFYTK